MKTKRKPNRKNVHGYSPERIDKILETYDRLSGNFGIESVTNSSIWNSYYCDIHYLYSNTGDSYDNTLIFNADKKVLFIGCIGDVLERM